MEKIVVAVNGSLRINSSSHIVMKKFIELALPEWQMIEFERLAAIPPFDGSEIDPEPVEYFKDQIKKADAIVICTPEYAFGVPGALKNALDWTVGSGELLNKPVALITASSSGEKGHRAMQDILAALSAKVENGAAQLITAIRSKVKDGKLVDAQAIESVRSAIEALSKSLI